MNAEIKILDEPIMQKPRSSDQGFVFSNFKNIVSSTVHKPIFAKGHQFLSPNSAD